MATKAKFTVGQKVKYNQGRGKGLIGKVIQVNAEEKTVVIKGDAHDLAFRRSFSAIKPAPLGA